MILIGTDEAGRGPLAGPVMAAAALLTPFQEAFLVDRGLTDSKKLSETRRERLFSLMLELGVQWRAQAASPARIDRDNILQASLWAMRRSVMKLGLEPDLVVVDGTQTIPSLPFSQEARVKADSEVPQVAAASIVAKVLRDRVMVALDRCYPGWGFAGHKGYPTKKHREAVKALGFSPVHRRSFTVK